MKAHERFLVTHSLKNILMAAASSKFVSNPQDRDNTQL